MEITEDWHKSVVNYIYYGYILIIFKVQYTKKTEQTSSVQKTDKLNHLTNPEYNYLDLLLI